jgi:hypothetical protein
VLYGLSVAFGSYAFFGAPFFESLYGKKGLDMAVFTGSFLSIFGLIMSITLFEYAGRAGKGAGFILRVLRSPLIISIVLGLMVSVFMPQLRFLADICAPSFCGQKRVAAGALPRSCVACSDPACFILVIGSSGNGDEAFFAPAERYSLRYLGGYIRGQV